MCRQFATDIFFWSSLKQRKQQHGHLLINIPCVSVTEIFAIAGPAVVDHLI
jgi:hypothetical protein